MKVFDGSFPVSKAGFEGFELASALQQLAKLDVQLPQNGLTRTRDRHCLARRAQDSLFLLAAAADPSEESENCSKAALHRLHSVSLQRTASSRQAVASSSVN